MLAFNTGLWGAWFLLLLALVLWYKPYLVGERGRRAANVITGVVAPLLWDKLGAYRQTRLLVFLDPTSDPLRTGYHVIQSQVAIGSGGWLGKGFTMGTQKRLAFLPEQHTDFIFSVVGEELGFIGVTVALTLFAFLFFRVVRVAARASDSFSSLVAFGLLAIWFMHVVENVGMTLNLMPITGIPLPFFSYGGSFMFACWLAVGILTRISGEGRGAGQVASLIRRYFPRRWSPPRFDGWLGSGRRRSSASRGASSSRFPRTSGRKCEACGHTDIREKFVRNLNVCPNCDYHRRIRAHDYAAILLDDGTIEEVEVDLRSTDPLGFPEYPARLKKATNNAGDTDALLTATGMMDGAPVNLGVMDFAFMGGSMGSVVGEKIARLGQRSLERKYPLIIVSASGGARMQEGVLSLMQMAKVSAVLAQLAERRIPYVSILTNPTTGGVSASYAMLGDAILAEPGAVIGFAGPRVIKQTLGQDLPRDSRRRSSCSTTACWTRSCIARTSSRR